ncbi:MAG: hypothetical protein BWX70_00668 [Verrucomicrobia bacterium ADurb.Bin070]|nr:MAG: hypothetical protein BWX70_00668 [Verrucomicrobia bacterium ADurb.Bin070]
MSDDKRLIEDFLPIEAISAEASREKSVRKGHISTLHLWWARRPLVACRAAVYGALVPASRFVPNGGSDDKKKSLGRANAARFVKSLCRYPSDSKPEEKASIGRAVGEAERHILLAHADRLTEELADWRSGKTGKPGWVDEFKFVGDAVTFDDILAGRAPRPRVLDPFAGGGAIPLEALRLGCEAYANDLNPVAHIIQLCTLVYPQKFGKPDPADSGMTGPADKDGNPTWGGLADEVRYWGEWVLRKVKCEIGDLYPPIPDPEYKGARPPIAFDRKTGEWVIARGDAGTPAAKDDPFAPPQMVMGFAEDDQMRLSPASDRRSPASASLPPGYLQPVAYLWTRTVTCKNPACGATVPLVKQTWLCKKKDRYVALKMIAPKGEKQVRFEVVEAKTEKGLGFDPEAFSKAGNATCPFCGTVADSDYVKAEGCSKSLGFQAMALLAIHHKREGKTYVASYQMPDSFPKEEVSAKRLMSLCAAARIDCPGEPIVTDAKNSCWTPLYGLNSHGDLFSKRQLLSLMTFAANIRRADEKMQACRYSLDRSLAILSFLAATLDKQADRNSVLCVILADGGRGIKNTFVRQALPMSWDFAEANPFNPTIASWSSVFKEVLVNIDDLNFRGNCNVTRGNASELPYEKELFDAIITDPPYYDNVPYANISDFFYVWLKRSIGCRMPEHFAGMGTPKKAEAVADAARHGGNKRVANAAYENAMSRVFSESFRTLKTGGPLIVVYAHKTTLGWATLIDALRLAGFLVDEAWPLDTETKGRLRAHDASALASSIFLVARKRDASAACGNYESDVVPELAGIVRERVETLWDMGISGADLVIACVGAGLRAFTKYARVEFANGEEVPAERFLSEVESVVLETILGKLSKTIGAKAGETLSGLDPATRFYVLWRYTYGGAELDAGEAIIFANGTHVELDGHASLTAGARALLEKKKGKYRLLDFTERGQEDRLGLPDEDRQDACPTVDALHRLLWLVDHKPLKIPDFLTEAKPNVEQLRLVAQALSGPALSGGEIADVSTTAEQSALGKLLANWNAVMVGKTALADKRVGQQQLL